MTATFVPDTTTSPDVTTADGPARSLATAPVWRVGAVAGVVAALATAAVAAVARGVFDVPMAAGPASADGPQEIPALGFIPPTLVATAIGTILAVVLYRRAARPARTFVIATVVLTVVSFVSPFTTHYITTATQVVLEITHVVAAAIVIPTLAWRLAQRPERS